MIAFPAQRPFRSRSITLAACGVLVAGCALPTRPRLPEGTVPFTALPVYATWWSMAQQCTGRAGALESVQWYRAPGRVLWIHGGSEAAFWSPRGNTIVVAAEQVEQGPVIRHEMVHALLRGGGHRRDVFLGSCAGLVACGKCVTDGGPWRAPRSWVLLPTDSLRLDVRTLVRPAERDGARWLEVEVSVRNPTASDVILRSSRGTERFPTFQFDLRGPAGGISGGEIATDSSALHLLPFGEKSWLFEFRVGGKLEPPEITSGDYLVRGGFDRQWSPYERVSVQR